MAKIWIVDDDRNLVNLTKGALLNKRDQVVILHEARKAIQQVKEEGPDLILMDII